MDEDAGPTLAEDEAKLAEYSAELVKVFGGVALEWLQRLVDSRAPGMGALPPVIAALRTGAESTVAELRALLELDIADQPAGPLAILRSAVRYPTEVLATAGVSPVDRDDFAVSSFPGDVYDLTPASFAAVDPALHEPGLVWGAAKAHVHLRRRREPKPRVAALSVDLMDRSKISAAFPDAKLVRSVTKLRDALVDSDNTVSDNTVSDNTVSVDLVFVDLGCLDDVEADLATVMRALAGSAEGVRVVGFGSHVDDATLAAATAGGVDAMARSVFFRRLELGSF